MYPLFCVFFLGCWWLSWFVFPCVLRMGVGNSKKKFLWVFLFLFCLLLLYSHPFDFYSYILESFCLGLWIRCQIIWYFWVRNFSRKISCCSRKIDAWFHEEWRDRILSRSISREHVVFLLLLLLLLLQKFTCTHIIDAWATGRWKLHFV
jgi:hypothetical protein